MDSNTTIMLLALIINFLVMLVGGIKLMHVIVQSKVEQEHRMATIEEQIRQLMRATNLKVRAVA